MNITAKRFRATVFPACVLSLAVIAAGCSSTATPDMQLALSPTPADAAFGDVQTQAYPDTINVLPEARPDTVALKAPQPEVPVGDGVAVAQAPVTAPAPADATQQLAAAPSAPQQPQPADPNARIAVAHDVSAAQQPVMVASATPLVPQSATVAAAQPAPKPAAPRGGFLSGFFSEKRPAANLKTPVPAAAPAPQAEQPVRLALADPQDAAPKRTVITTGGTQVVSASLPGVRDKQLFEIERRNSIEEIGDEEEFSDEPVRVASAAGLARLSPNGLRIQHDGVDVKCFKPELVRLLKTVERKYGRPVVVTSGYRSPSHNKRIRGAKNSLHMYCSAADIQVEGVSKWALASYMRSMPGRGGVGTYCHTDSVHVDIGPERDWNWRCRRKK